MNQPATLFTPERFSGIQEFYRTYEPNHKLFDLRKIQPHEPVKNLFYGDSITAIFPLKDFFPNHSLLNKGIPGDTLPGLWLRLEEDLLPFTPRRVFLMAGINGIEEDETLILNSFHALVERIRQSGSEVIICSMTPLRFPDQWNRFQYQDKIVRINRALQEWAGDRRNADGFLDYHSAVKDADGQLPETFVSRDGTHPTLPCFIEMAKLLKPFLLA